jgi:DNA repair protein RadC
MKSSKVINLTDVQLRARSRIKLVKVGLIPNFGHLSETLSGPEAVAEFARAQIGSCDREHVIVIHLDTKHRAVSMEVVSIGTLAFAPICPREVFKAAILSNSESIICAHNHPSGNPTPSPEDFQAMERLRSSGELLGIRLLDFLVVTETGHLSLLPG